ncbi:MAG: GPI anchored serine-threonine rich family protein [Candidatus Paceibacterota bacterium]|jgi:hypothetical protein
MNKYQKGFAPIIVVLIILVLAGVGGTGYYLMNKKSKSLNNQNQQFSIIPSFTVISPKQGESLEIGKTYEITWNSQNVETVSFFLQIQGETDIALIIGNDIRASLGKYSWTIPTDGYKFYATSHYRIGVFADDNNLPIAYSDWFSIISSVTPDAIDEIGFNPCENKGGFVDYFAKLNFDGDLEKEMLVICGDFQDPEVGGYNEGRKLYVFDKQNKEYKLIWEKDTSKDDDGREYRSMKKPEIVDVDKDGVDEIFFRLSNWGGTWYYSDYFLYSPKYNEIFRMGTMGEGDKILNATSSDNLNIVKYKIFKNFLNLKKN